MRGVEIDPRKFRLLVEVESPKPPWLMELTFGCVSEDVLLFD